MSTVIASDVTVKLARARLAGTLTRATVSVGVVAAGPRPPLRPSCGRPAGGRGSVAVHGKIPLAGFAQITFVGAVIGAAHRLHLDSMESDHDPDFDRLDDFVDVVADDQLRLMFLCAHPALAADAQIALILRLLGGLETGEIAKAFVVPEATMAQRIVRAKRRLHDNRASYRIPRAAELPVRRNSVLAAIYLIYTEGSHRHLRAEADQNRPDAQAIRVGRTPD